MKAILASLGFLIPVTTFAGNVILITIDGVRPEDASRVFAGSPALVFPLRVGNSEALSLPGYRTLLSGLSETGCKRNHGCTNIQAETLIDRFIDRGATSSDVAAFASWKELGLALESRPRTCRIVAGKNSGACDHFSVRLSRQIESLCNQAAADLPLWKEAIKDEYTWSMAMAFLEEKKPKLLYISLLDTDEWAHRNNFTEYDKTLRLLRRRIELLQQRLQTMGEYGEDTTIFLTTDHGRGYAPFFLAHGPGFPHSYEAWARVFPSPKAARAGVSYHLKSQIDVRPTIERILYQE